MTTLRVIQEVFTERRRQDQRWGEQNHPDGTAQGGDADLHTRDTVRSFVDGAAKYGLTTWALILAEEVAEAYAESDPVKLRTELVQVAAVTVAWIESIDRRGS